MEYQKFGGFIHDEYYKCYDRELYKGANRNSDLHELHHLLPKSFGGTYKYPLTFKEHYICHWLLTKFTAGADRHKMIVAMSFSIITKLTRPLYANKSRAYSNFKRILIEAQKERLQDPTLNPFIGQIYLNGRVLKLQKIRRYRQMK